MIHSANTCWHESIPCFHRIHQVAPKSGAHKVQHQLGMSLSLDTLKQQLQKLAAKLHGTGKKALITFDDGYKDVLLSLSIFEELPSLQPVLFITGQQLQGGVRPLPLTIFYDWCAALGINPDKTKECYGFNRNSLKQLNETQQYELLKKIGADFTAPEKEMLTQKDINKLRHCGWLIAYHGPEHYDLRHCPPQQLKQNLARDIKIVRQLNYQPWIAWPEGRVNQDMFLMAQAAGFTLQFNLEEESEAKAPQLWDRSIWQ